VPDILKASQEGSIVLHICIIVVDRGTNITLRKGFDGFDVLVKFVKSVIGCAIEHANKPGKEIDSDNMEILFERNDEDDEFLLCNLSKTKVIKEVRVHKIA